MDILEKISDALEDGEEVSLGRHRVRVELFEEHPRMAPSVDSVAVNLILNFQHVKFEAFADYQVNLTVDDQSISSLPLRVRELPQQHMA